MNLSTLNFESMVYLKQALYSIVVLCCMFFIPNSVSSQTIDHIAGTVVDKQGEPLIGVSILIKGTSIGTITNADGNFTLTNKTMQNPVLQVSYLGFIPQEITVTGLSPLHIVMAESTKSLDEVVVVGYGSQRKKDLTGAVAVVEPKDLNNIPVATIGDALEGRAAGVQIISSGVPGNDPTVLIRGIGTINDASPLFVIDGVPVSSGLGELNMNDVQSIQVLKDASATAIYGSRGANGVVIVTTKHGTTDSKPRMNLNYYFGIQQAAKIVHMLDASQFSALHNDMMTNAGLAKDPAYANPASLGQGTDWLGALFTTAPMHNISFSYSVGGSKSSYYVSGNYIDQNGIVINTGYKKLTLQFNSDTKISDKLRFGNSITLNHDIRTNGNYNIQNTMLALPTQPIYRTNGNYSGPVAQPIWDGDLVNPIGLAKTVDNATNGYNIIGSIYGELEIISGLKLKSTVGLQGNLWDSRTWAPEYTWDTSINSQAYLSEQYNKNFTWNWDNTLTYDKSFGKHHLTVMAGTSAQENQYNYLNGSVQNFASELTQQMSNGTSNPTVGGDASSWSLLSYMGRVNYNYADKYLLTGTLRRDGSSRFGSGNKWGLFPSGSAAWRISKEKFFRNIHFVDDLKLRAGFGITGNQQIGNYSFASALQTITYNFNNSIVSAVVPSVMPNPNVQWEEQKQTNVGIDAVVLNDRIDFTIDGYLKYTDKMLVPMSVPITTGYSDVYVPSINAGKMENKGIELTVNSRNLTGKFKWSSSFNVAYNQNKVVSINDTVPMTTGSIGLNYNLALIQAGHPINSFYGYVTDGIFQTQAEVNNHALQVPGNDPYNRTSPGDIRFKDLNNDGVINDKDRTFLGNPNPTFIFSLNNTFSYMGFDLSIYLQGVAGNKIFNANRIWDEGMSVAQNQTTAVLARWTGPGTSNSMPRAIYNDPNENTRPSDRYIEDGSYLRIKNITLNYTIPQKWLKSVSLTSARVYVSAENLYTFTKYSGFDPEVGASGIDNNVYPVTRTISMGVNLGF
ncbi:SusC/RagA family TonB-linked outer membrane protein [Microbacter margulisiae]|uniref:TonB-linked SusC/RagA family outer membrane protein n=1 Tax=Microbacter margulisiae TaxID=1350067 RepID=A0A7W5DSW2_9PORP|nr:TonB-dependent receptor [Microbacter margulisiae]MBB3188138.1 TonB-linked SusC/RagA family outer membrane protein [Microbacter margulisiae]